MAFSHTIITSVASAGVMSVVATFGSNLYTSLAPAIGGGHTPTTLNVQTMRPELPFDGADVDHNGIRDDVDAMIASLPDSALQKTALRQSARAMTRAMALIGTSPNDDAVKQASIDLNTARRCLTAMYPAEQVRAKLDSVQSAVANTNERRYTYVRFNGLAADFAVGARSDQACEEESTG